MPSGNVERGSLALLVLLGACGIDWSTPTPKHSDDSGPAREPNDAEAERDALPPGQTLPDAAGEPDDASEQLGLDGGVGAVGAFDADSALALDGAFAEDAAVDAAAVPDLPTQGMLRWFRADRGVTSDAAGVSVWADQSGNAANAGQLTAAARPAFRTAAAALSAAVVFDGVDDFLALPGAVFDFSAGVTMVLVVSNGDTDGAVYMPFFEASNGTEIDDISIGRYVHDFHFEVLEQTLNPVVLPPGVVQLLSARLTPALALTMRRNGVTAAVATFQQLPATLRREDVFIGASRYADAIRFHGEMYELVLYNRALSDAELLNVEQVLTARWQCCTP